MGAVGLYREQLLPRLLHVSMRGWPFGAQRPRCVARAAGRVLEIGFGSGLNLPHYGPEVSELLALEPSAVARRLARDAIARAPFPVRFLGLEASSIPLDDACADCVVSTWTLCTVPDVAGALAEIRRVLRPGGELIVLDFTEPTAFGLRQAYRFYFSRVLPVIGGWISGNRQAYAYLPRSVGTFPQGRAFLELLQDAGFSDPRHVRLSFGISAVYQGSVAGSVG
jgi:ubiquinone/menaquinone biosynthesis methyltransferase